jgi:hypothetical protein
MDFWPKSVGRPEISKNQCATHDELEALRGITVTPAGRFSEVSLPADEIKGW